MIRIVTLSTEKKSSGAVSHMKYKHSKIEEMVGKLDKDSDDELISSRNYWKYGHIGKDYQAYLDICKICQVKTIW